MTSTTLAQISATGILKTNTFGDRYLYNINRGNFDKVGAHAIFDAEFSKHLLEEDSLNIVIGTDSGLLPKYVQQQGIPSGTRYIFIEPEQVLEQLHHHQLLEDMPPEIVCTTLGDWEEEAKEFKIHEYAYINNIKSFNAICSQQTVLDEYSELSWKITEALRTIHYRYNVSLGSELFITRQIENIADNIFPMTCLENAYQDKTVIILGGAPSLTTVFPWLLENRHKLVVFSVSRISRQLISAGIEPDFVFSVDPLNENIDVSREMFLFGSRTVFISSYHVQPALINQWHGQNLYLGIRLPWQSDLNIANIHGTGPTVTHSAFSVAHYFGFSKILLAGFDQCFTKEGITHALGSDEQLIGPTYDPTLLQVETYSGEYRPTSPGYYAAILTLTELAKNIGSERCEIINLAPTAAKVEHISHIPCTEITLLELEGEDLDNIKQRIPKLNDAVLQAHYQAVIDELEKANFQIKAIAKLAKKALDINESMYSAEGRIENYKDKRELDSIEKQLKRKYRKHSKLVKNFGIRQFIKITSPHDSDDWDAEKAKKLGNIYYQAYQSGANKLSNLITSAIARTKARQEELKAEPDFDLLLAQWDQDKSYRRALFWLQKHPQTPIPEQTALALTAMQDQFNRVMTQQDTAFKAEVARSSTLPLLKSKIKILFKHKKIDELIDLKSGFIDDTKHDDKAAYLLLIEGYIAELNNDADSALIHYHQILDIDQSPLLEEALVQIAAISLDRHDQQNTLLALECLSQLSPTYLPYQAELARITGDHLLAIDSYNTYIAFFPEDSLSKLKLASLYIDIKVYEAAELMLEHILQTTPDFESAINLKKQLAAIKQQVC